jgi:enhancing lycopene biosynthesis protein 2
MKIGVLLSGNGVYDGSEIQEVVFTLLAIDELGGKALCFAPDKPQHHVVNHLSGEEMNESRNVLVESARVTRGDIKSIMEVNVNDFEALVIPGGFGAAKNLTSWAFDGSEGTIDEEVKRIIVNCIKIGKPIAALCMGPTVVAKALEKSGVFAELTVGTTAAKSPYDIQAISKGMDGIGVKSTMKGVKEIAVDEQHKIVSAPCYMMEASISEVRNNVKQAIVKLIELVKKQ